MEEKTALNLYTLKKLIREKELITIEKLNIIKQVEEKEKLIENILKEKKDKYIKKNEIEIINNEIKAIFTTNGISIHTGEKWLRDENKLKLKLAGEDKHISNRVKRVGNKVGLYPQLEGELVEAVRGARDGGQAIGNNN